MSKARGYEALTWRHVIAWKHEVGGWLTVSDARLTLTPMVGYAYRGPDGTIQFIGGVFFFKRPEAMFAMRPEFAANRQRSALVHRPALEVLTLAHRVAPIIYARADAEIPRSTQWLERLGFAPPEYPGEFWTHVGGGVLQSGRVILAEQHRDRCHLGRYGG